MSDLHLPLAYYPGRMPWLCSAENVCGVPTSTTNTVLLRDEIAQVTCPECRATFDLLVSVD